jgi:leukotriene-A4 hydrolase
VTEQKTWFLDLLLQLPVETQLQDRVLQSLDKTYGLTANNNAEVKFRWQMLCLKMKARWIYPHVVSFVTSQGRMKFVRPLYRAMRDCDEESARLAVATFTAKQDM